MIMKMLSKGSMDTKQRGQSMLSLKYANDGILAILATWVHLKISGRSHIKCNAKEEEMSPYK